MSFQYQKGESPILISIPHNGFEIPHDIQETMTDAGKSSRDTDWFLDRLYQVPSAAPANLMIAEVSRYVIDLNRPANNESLYPGQTTTGLVPETCFDGASIYRSQAPSEEEVERRIEVFWRPYHDKLREEMNRLVSEYGVAVLVEAHSIASRVPRLFPGQLPDFNIGTNRQSSCDNGLEQAVVQVLRNQSKFSFVVNERFVGGYLTRYFGQPEKGWHAVQIELSQATYMDESRLEWDDEKANRVQVVFQELLMAVQEWAKTISKRVARK